MRFTTFFFWLGTAALGAFMLRTWLARGGLRRERARAGGLPPQLIFGHATLALTGLLTWVIFLATGARPAAWVAVGLLMITVGLGLCTVTLWTPYPASRPGERRAPGHVRDPVRDYYMSDYAAGAPTAADPNDPADATDPADPDFEVTDEMIARLLDEEPPPGSSGDGAGWASASPGLASPLRPNPEVLVPVAHGFLAIGTFILAVMSAIM